MRNDLIGYVLGALDVAEEDQIRQKLQYDEGAQKELELAKRSLRPLRFAASDQDPPDGLTSRTLSQVDAFSADSEQHAGSDVVTPAVGLSSAAFEVAESERRWVMADFVVALGVCVAAACLLFPALANSRWHSQLAGCQNNMRDAGTALIDYSSNQGGYFPQIPASGKLSVAGIYAPKLMEKGFVNDVRVFRCPAKGNTVVLKMPQIKDIVAARGPRLVTLHRTMGGDYAYPLGFVQNGRLQGVRNQGRTHSALLADAPMENVRNVAIGTHGRGQNVLFEDGHVEFMTKRIRPGTESDDLFFNDDGFVLAGLHDRDAVLAPSPVSPLSAAVLESDPPAIDAD